MTDLARLRREAAALAPDLRAHALAFEHDPDLPRRLAHLPVYTALAAGQVPPEHNPAPPVLGGHRFHLHSTVERAVFFEEAARGDMGLTLAAPGAHLAGLAVELLGDQRQRAEFFGRLLDRPSWTALAMTEPGHGSDIAGMASTFTATEAGGHVLSGRKWAVANTTRADVAVVFARTGAGPLGLRAAVLDPAAEGVHARPVATLGLRHVLGELAFDAVPLPGPLLGGHLPPTRRGLWAWQRTIGLARPVAAAMALGLAGAALDYTREHRDTPAARDALDRLARRRTAVRRLIGDAAAAADAGTGEDLAAAAVHAATALAGAATRRALGLLGPGARAEHPLLDRWARDALGVEAMDGTTNIQRLTLFTSLNRGGPLTAEVVD